MLLIIFLGKIDCAPGQCCISLYGKAANTIIQHRLSLHQEGSCGLRQNELHFFPVVPAIAQIERDRAPFLALAIGINLLAIQRRPDFMLNLAIFAGPFEVGQALGGNPPFTRCIIIAEFGVGEDAFDHIFGSDFLQCHAEGDGGGLCLRRDKVRAILVAHPDFHVKKGRQR